MSATKRLSELDSSLVPYVEGMWGKSSQPAYPEFSSFNDAGIECETGEFLYSLVRLLKPKHILETGTHQGVGACYMALGLKDNGGGRLTTIEFLPQNFAVANARFQITGLKDHISPIFGDVANFNGDGDYLYDLILLDTEPQTRFAEFVRFEKNLKKGGFIFIHDLHRHMHQIPSPDHAESPYNGFAWPYGQIPAKMKELVKSGLYRPIHFSTPRGLTGFYKVSDDDYLW